MRTAVSSFLQKRGWNLIKHIFVGQNIRKPTWNYSLYLKYSSKLRRWFIRHFYPMEVHKCPPLEGVESQDKCTRFFIINSIFHLILRLLGDVDFRFKVTKELLISDFLLLKTEYLVNTRRCFSVYKTSIRNRAVA